jgi:sulfur carrier protein ThiS
MANNVIVQVAGGSKQVLDGVSTVADVRSKLGTTDGYTASLNGDPVESGATLEDNDMVTFAKAVKGGLA